MSEMAGCGGESILIRAECLGKTSRALPEKEIGATGHPKNCLVLV